MSMETDSPVVYHGTSESRFPKAELPMVKELTAEEKEILRQCNKESLYYRCLPFSLTGMAAVYFAARKGYIRSHPVWGPVWSMSGAALLGWILGKFTYSSKCEEKFLHLENSSLADAIRKRRGFTLERYQQEFQNPEMSAEDITLKDGSYSYYSGGDYHPSTGSLNLDVDKNIQFSGLDDRERPSADRDSMQFSDESEPVRKFTTYDDLRQRNREEYDRSQRSSYLSSPRLDLSPPVGQRSYSNIDTTSSRRYNFDTREGERRSTYDNNWDNAKLL